MHSTLSLIQGVPFRHLACNYFWIGSYPIPTARTPTNTAASWREDALPPNLLLMAGGNPKAAPINPRQSTRTPLRPPRPCKVKYIQPTQQSHGVPATEKFCPEVCGASSARSKQDLHRSCFSAVRPRVDQSRNINHHQPATHIFWIRQKAHRLASGGLAARFCIKYFPHTLADCNMITCSCMDVAETESITGVEHDNPSLHQHQQKPEGLRSHAEPRVPRDPGCGEESEALASPRTSFARHGRMLEHVAAQVAAAPVDFEVSELHVNGLCADVNRC